MLGALVGFSLRYRGIVIALACVLLGTGIGIVRRAPIDVFPDFVPPQVVVQTESPGLTPEQVETLVTRPVESAINGAGGIQSIRSESIPGLSIVTVVFYDKTDLYRARQTLNERLIETSGHLPSGVRTPKMTPLTSSTMDLLKIGLRSTNLTPMELRTFADWTLRPRLLAAPGVAKVGVFGGEVRQLQIRVRPERLVAFDLSLSDVVAGARWATGVRGSGFIETSGQRILVQTEGQSLSAEALGDVILGESSGRVRLRDVADVVEGAEPKFGDGLVQGEPGVLLTLSSQYGANTREATRSVEAALDELRPAIASKGIELFDRLHRPATFIENALANIRSSLWVGAILVSLVLFLFLFNLRTAIISLAAIPLSLLTALVLLDVFGVTLNTLTLGGLAIALGEVVDDAIIDVENILRRLRENELSGRPREFRAVILSASLEVRTAVVYATFVVALVFVPVITMTGLQGKFFAPLGVAYVLAILASLLVALTVTPALSAFCFRPGMRLSGEPRFITRLKGAYAGAVSLGMGHARWVGALALLACLAGLILLPGFSTSFLPEFREGHFVLQVAAAPGTSLPEMTRMGRQISLGLLHNPHVATVEVQNGRAEAGEDPWGPHRAEFHVELHPVSPDEEEATQKAIRDLLTGFPGLTSEVLTFLGDRIGETISGETAQVVVNVFGNDLDDLDAVASEIAARLNTIPGHVDVRFKNPPGSPRLNIQLRPDRLRQFGFSPLEVMETIETAGQGTVVGAVYDHARVSDVVVILAPEHRQEPEQWKTLWVQNARGTRLPLSELADLDLTSGRDSIQHEGARRRQTVTCNVAGRSINAFVGEAKERVRHLPLPDGVYLAFSGVAEQGAAAIEELRWRGLVSAVGIVLLLSMVLAHWRNVLLVLANLPFALLGGVIGVALTGGVVSLGSLVGFVTLFGISTRNSILLVSHYEQLASEGMGWSSVTAVRGAAERVIPILMTALVTGLGLLPLAIGSGEAGREIEGPMAVVILGGLASSTLLNLAVLPILAARYGRFGQEPAGKR